MNSKKIALCPMLVLSTWLLLTANSSIAACTLYVDSAAGSDSNDGLSELSPWRTLQRVNDSTLAAGTEVCFKRDSVWREQLTVTDSGTPANKIRFASYGTGANPVFKWNENLIPNGGFERYTGTIDDIESDGFDNWATYNTENENYIRAVSTSESGQVALKIHRQELTEGVTVYQPYIRGRNSALRTGTNYYIEVRGRLESGSVGGLKIALFDDSNDLHLQSDGTWNTAHNTFTILETGNDTWTTWALPFTTSTLDTTGTGKINLRIDIGAATHGMTAYMDNIYLGPGSTRPDEAVELAYIQDMSILVDSVSHIEVDSIDLQGPHPQKEIPSHSTLLRVAGTSTDVWLSNLDISGSKGIGITADNTTSDIHYRAIDSHHNMNTGIYMNAQGGSIMYCKSHDNGRLPEDIGDRGGIGVFQGGDIDIIGNEVYRNAQDDNHGDGEISVVDATSPVRIIGNHIHNAGQGGIQVRDIELASGDLNYQGGNVIAYNIVDGFATSTWVQPTGGRAFSGITLGHTAGGSPNAKVYNNVITNGGTPAGYDSAGIWVQHTLSRNADIRNNILYNNGSKDIQVDWTVFVPSNQPRSDQAPAPVPPTLSNNLYYRDSGSYQWVWEEIRYDPAIYDFSAWTTASGETAPKLADPGFVDAPNGDFHLGNTSPAIGGGTPVGFTQDQEGNPIVGLPDIGALESADEPVVAEVSPWQLPRGKLTDMTITGGGFQAGVSVIIQPAHRTVINTVSLDSSTTLRIQVSVINGAKKGFRDLTIINPDGRSYTLTGGVLIQ